MAKIRARQLLAVFGLLLFGLLMLSIVAFAQDVEVDEDGAQALLSELQIATSPQTNCAVPIAELNGEIIRGSGASGGFEINPSGHTNTPPFTGFMSLSGGGPTPVAILVIDDFNAGGYEVESRYYISTPPLAPLGSPSHGSLVFNHISALLDAEGFFASPSPDFIQWTNGTSTIGVFVVDALDYPTLEPTAVLRDRIGDAIDMAMTMGFSRIVVNMSFAIVPCLVLDEFGNINPTSILSFEMYAKMVEDLTGDPETASLMGSPTEGSVQDPLHQLIDNYRNELPDQIFFVAASGNAAPTFSFAFFPASWESVIGIEALEGGAPASYSQPGDEAREGGWFQLIDPQGLNGGWMDSIFYYRGTSFAAPTFSTELAINLSTP